MNLPRLRELVKAWQDGTIREAELCELRDALPEVLDLAETGQNFVEAVRTLVPITSDRHL